MRKFLLVALLLVTTLAYAQNGPTVAKDPGTSNTVNYAGEVAIPGPNLARQSFSVCCDASSTYDCRFRKAKTVTGTTGVPIAKGSCYSEPIGGEKAYTGPIAVAASTSSTAGVATYYTLEN